MDYRGFIADKVVLVSGGVGTVGSALVDALLELAPREVRVLDNNETELFLLAEAKRDDKRLSVRLGDVRDPFKLEAAMEGAQVVFHTAAFKHVVLCEQNPFEAVQTNVLGLQNVIQGAIRAGVENLVFTSSDKAANPTSVMGTSKLMGERLVSASTIFRQDVKQAFVSTRFGNVVGSRGSVVPVFARQIAHGGPVTLTNPEMTRFIMTTGQAVELILSAGALAKGGEVVVPRMPACRIEDLAKVMIEELAPAWGRGPESIEIKIIGAKPGEKLFEELLTEDESRRSLVVENLFVTPPAFTGLYAPKSYEYPGAVKAEGKPYTSHEAACLSQEELAEFFREREVLQPFKPKNGRAV